MKKYCILITAITLVVQTPLCGQDESFKKAEVENRIEVDGDIDVAWTCLSNLGNLQYLAPSTIKKSTLKGNGKGCVVTLTLANNATIIEEVVKLDNKKRRIAYTMIETPLPIKNYVASFIVNKISDQRFEIIFTAKFKVQDKNRKARVDAFNALQVELLQNIKSKTHENG